MSLQRFRRGEAQLTAVTQEAVAFFVNFLHDIVADSVFEDLTGIIGLNGGQTHGYRIVHRLLERGLILLSGEFRNGFAGDEASLFTEITVGSYAVFFQEYVTAFHFIIFRSDPAQFHSLGIGRTGMAAGSCQNHRDLRGDFIHIVSVR